MSAPAFVILIVCFASVALAEDFKTINGKEYKNATVSRVEPDGIVVRTTSGISKIYFVELPKEVQARYGHDPAKIEAQSAAARVAEEKRIEKEKAAQREREERAKTAEAHLKRLLEQFQVAEQRSAQAYQSAAKGTLSGQVFVSTKGGENFKLGAVEVALFARDAIDVLLAGLKTNADIEIQQLRPSVDSAKTAYGQAEAAERAAYQMSLNSIGRRDHVAAERAWKEAEEAHDKAREQYFEISGKLDRYYSGAFYLGFLGFPIQRAETDADGKFVIQLPERGRFVISAQAQRSVGGGTEHYYWLQPVSLDGQQQLTQNLSNNNLTSTTGTSSLVHTKD
jgi:hypothetical protein